MAKNSIKGALSNDYFFNKSSEVISYLSDKFDGEAYKFVEIDSAALAELRAEETL